MATVGKYGKVTFTNDEKAFIKDNFQSMTNQQIADALGLKKTLVRMFAYELGLQRMKLEYWPNEAVEFLKENYHKIGDRELCRIFTTKFPKEKGWTPKHFKKKLSQLGLKRTKLDLWVIKERNRDNGSFGKKSERNKSVAPKLYFHIDEKTRIEIKPGQSILEIKQKYENRRHNSL